METDEMETETTADGETGEASELIERVAAHDEELAAQVEERLTEAEETADEQRERAEELESKLKRTRADFENYKKRAEKRREQAAERATADIVERLTEVRNNLLRALEQDSDADIRPGVESTLETFDRVLESEGVTPVEPDPGTEVDPQRHEVMVRVESSQPEDTIADVYNPGYETDQTVIEPAQVTVSDGSLDDDSAAVDSSDGEAGDAGDGGSDPAAGSDDTAAGSDDTAGGSDDTANDSTE
jgi:molecular chaperone GrpE